MLARTNRDFLHVTSHAFVSVVVILDDFLRFHSRDSDALRQAPRLDRISDSKVDYLGKPARLFELFGSLRAEDESRRARVDVFTFLKRFQHHRILRDVGQQPQLELRIVSGDDLVSLLRNESAADTPAHLAANGNVL